MTCPHLFKHFLNCSPFLCMFAYCTHVNCILSCWKWTWVKISRCSGFSVYVWMGRNTDFFWKPRRGHPRFASWLGVISVCSNIGKCELRAFGFSKLKEWILYCVYLEEHKLCWQRSDGEVRPNCFQQRFSKRANTCPVCTWTVIWCVFSRAFEWTENLSDMVLKQTTKKCYSAAGYVFRVVCSEWNQCLN